MTLTHEDLYLYMEPSEMKISRTMVSSPVMEDDVSRTNSFRWSTEFINFKHGHTPPPGSKEGYMS